MRYRWRPDTCECIVGYDGVENEQMVNPVVVQPCALHAGLMSPSEMLAHVMDRNQYKNTVHQYFLDNGADNTTLRVHYEDDGLVVVGHDLTKRQVAAVRNVIGGSKYINRKLRVA